MSMDDIKTDTHYAARFVLTSEDMKKAKSDILAYKREKFAAEMGLKISEKKGWKSWPEGDMLFNEISVYVFSHNELVDYIEAMMKRKLREMATRDETKDIAQRLYDLSERI